MRVIAASLTERLSNGDFGHLWTSEYELAGSGIDRLASYIYMTSDLAALSVLQVGVRLAGAGSRRISDPAPLIQDPLPLITDRVPHS